MSRVKKIILAALVLSSLQFLSLSVFIKGAFCQSAQLDPALPKPSFPEDAGDAKIDVPMTAAAQSAFEIYGDLTQRLGGFLISNETLRVSPRMVIVVPRLFTLISAPKVSRGISKSVFNI